MENKGFDYKYESKEMDFAYRVFSKCAYPFSVSSKIFPDCRATFLHRHDFVQCWYCLEGEYIHYVENREYHCKSGSLVIIPPGIGHSFDIKASSNTRIVTIESTLFFFDSVPEPARTKAITNLFLLGFSAELCLSPKFYIQFEGEERDRFENVLSHLLKFDYSKNLPNILSIRKRFCEIFNLPSFSLSEKQLKTAEKLINTKLSPIMNTVLYMNKNFGAKIGCETLCSVSAMCYSDFFKYFKRILGITYTKYLRMLRIQRAKSFVAFSRYSFDYIADVCGLGDRTYLSRLYKKYLGYTMQEERARQKTTMQKYPLMTATHDSLDKLNLEFRQD